MLGNVWEWTRDCYQESYEGMPQNGTAHESDAGEDCPLRVLRGGSWSNGPRYVRSSNRDRNAPDARNLNIGFRLARIRVSFLCAFSLWGYGGVAPHRDFVVVTNTLPKVVQNCHNLMIWIVPLLDDFPRNRRFSLGKRLEDGLFEVLEYLVEAAYTRTKHELLRRANLRLAVVRHLWRMAHELEDHLDAALCARGQVVGRPRQTGWGLAEERWRELRLGHLIKRLGRVWNEVVSFENLFNAYRKARTGKQSSAAVAEFALNLESELLSLQEELTSLTYAPGRYRLFTIYERKKRQIAAAPFRDRVVHHAIMNVIEPPIDRRFVFDSYACRSKGVHAAVKRYQQWSRRYSYVLKMDIEQYFASIDHNLLKMKLRGCLKDKNVLAVLDAIIDTAPAATGRSDCCYFAGDDLLTPTERTTGLPIGNLTSQFFANLYLDAADHFIKETSASGLPALRGRSGDLGKRQAQAA